MVETIRGHTLIEQRKDGERRTTRAPPVYYSGPLRRIGFDRRVSPRVSPAVGDYALKMLAEKDARIALYEAALRKIAIEDPTAAWAGVVAREALAVGQGEVNKAAVACQHAQLEPLASGGLPNRLDPAPAAPTLADVQKSIDAGDIAGARAIFNAGVRFIPTAPDKGKP